MKRYVLFLLLLFPAALYPQNRGTYRTGITAEENLKAISNISPTSMGGIGFDTRYKGVKGSPMMFDTLQTSYLKIVNQDKYLLIESDIDLIANCVRFFHPRTKQALAVPAANVEELIITRGDSDLIFRTMSGSVLKKKPEDPVFYQVLNDDTWKLVKFPVKEFLEANYKQVYSPGRVYDEFYTVNKYFIVSPDGTMHQCQLSGKSLSKLFPEKKEIIKSKTENKNYTDKVQMVIDILKSF